MADSAQEQTSHGDTQLWLNLQNDFDVQITKQDLGKALDRIEVVDKPKAA